MAATVYSAHVLGPVLLERGRDNVLTCPVKRDGVLVAPASGTVSVWNTSDVLVVDAATVTITDNVATRTVAAATLSAEQYSDGWRVEWALAMPDGVVHTFRLAGALVYRLLYPVVSDGDLVGRHHDLPRRLAAAKLPSLQDHLDAAWAEIQGRLVELGKRPYLVADPTAFRRVHLYLALSLTFSDLSTTSDGNDDARAAKYHEDYERAWSELTFPQANPDGTGAGASRRHAAAPTLWLCSRGGL